MAEGRVQDRTNLALLAQSNHDFAQDLFHELTGRQPGANLLFSPHSMMNTLLMAAEGARHETSEEIGATLRFPPELHSGGAGDARPWRLAPLHESVAELNAALGADRPLQPDPAIDAELETVHASLDELSRRTRRRPIDGPLDDFRDLAAARQELRARRRALQEERMPYEIRVASALWVEATCALQRDFLETFGDSYGAVHSVDMLHAAEAVGTHINEWIADRTGGRIRNLIPPRAITGATRLVLTNAIYFHGAWREPFEQDRTASLPFQLADGGTTEVPLMRGFLECRYAAFEADGTYFRTPTQASKRGWPDPATEAYPGEGGFALAELAYRQSRCSMVLIAPDRPDGLPAVEKRLAAGLPDWVGRLRTRKVEVHLPRFRLTADVEMGRVLAARGMRRAFRDPREAGGAQFHGMTVSRNPEDLLFITAAFHRAFLDVREQGTEAAAATAILFSDTFVPRERPFIPVFRADRPFLFLLRDRDSGTILFQGRVTNPTAG